MLARVGKSQLDKSTLSKCTRCNVILALKDHSFIDSCCITLLYVYEKEMLLILEILDEIDWRVFKLKGVHRPIEVSAASAIAPALIAALVMKVGKRLFLTVTSKNLLDLH